MADQHSTAKVLPFVKPKAGPTHFKLTLKRIKDLLPPAKGSRYYYDTEITGLAVRVTAAGTKTYILARRINGRPQRVTLGKVGNMTLVDARKAAEVMNGRVAAGVDVVAEHKAARVKGATLGHLFTGWVASAEKRQLRSIHSDQRLWTLHVAPAIGRRVAADLTTADLQQLVDRIGKKHPRTANRAHALLSRVYKIAIKAERFIGGNPAGGVERFPENTRDRVLKPDEIETLIDAIQAEPWPWREYFMLLLFTGARLSAVAAMRWEDTDLDGGVWTVPAWASKNKTAMSLALVPQVVDVLQSMDRISSLWVFPSDTSRTGHITTPTKPWSRICSRAEISNLHIHDLRRTVGTLLAANGASAHLIAKALGHKSLQSAVAYVHMNTDPVRDILGTITAEWTGTAQKATQ